MMNSPKTNAASDAATAPVIAAPVIANPTMWAPPVPAPVLKLLLQMAAPTVSTTRPDAWCTRVFLLWKNAAGRTLIVHIRPSPSDDGQLEVRTLNETDGAVKYRRVDRVLLTAVHLGAERITAENYATSRLLFPARPADVNPQAIAFLAAEVGVPPGC